MSRPFFLSKYWIRRLDCRKTRKRCSQETPSSFWSAVNFYWSKCHIHFIFKTPTILERSEIFRKALPVPYVITLMEQCTVSCRSRPTITKWWRFTSRCTSNVSMSPETRLCRWGAPQERLDLCQGIHRIVIISNKLEIAQESLRWVSNILYIPGVPTSFRQEFSKKSLLKVTKSEKLVKVCLHSS